MFEEKEKAFIPKIAITFIFIFGMILYLGIRDIINNPSENILTKELIVIMFSGGILFTLLWCYCVISVLKNNFKKDSNKIVWLLALIFLPPTAIFYPDIKEFQIEKDNSTFTIN